MTRAEFEAAYENPSGQFLDNTTRLITELKMRTFSGVLSDSFLMLEDDYSYLLKRTTAGGADTYTISDTIPATYTDGEGFIVTFTNANTGAATLNRNGLGAKDLKTVSGAALTSGQIVAGGKYVVIYNGTYYMILGISASTVTLANGTYTPTGTSVTNISSSTFGGFQYMRVGSVVTVSGLVDVQATGAGAASELGISLPITSDINNLYDLAGTAVSAESGVAYNAGSVSGDATNNRAALKFYSTTTSTRSFYIHFTYRII